MELIGNNPITGNGTYTLKIDAGQRYAFGASAAPWSGSLAVQWVDDDGTACAFPDSPLTANGGFEFISPSGLMQFVMTGTSATTRIQVVPVK